MLRKLNYKLIVGVSIGLATILLFLLCLTITLKGYVFFNNYLNWEEETHFQKARVEIERLNEKIDFFNDQIESFNKNRFRILTASEKGEIEKNIMETEEILINLETIREKYGSDWSIELLNHKKRTADFFADLQDIPLSGRMFIRTFELKCSDPRKKEADYILKRRLTIFQQKVDEVLENYSSL